MTFKRQEYINKIIERLAFLKAKVEISNPLNLTDVNIISENFYRDFLNLLYGYSLININIIEHNAAAIDLADESEEIAFQVTSTSDLKKTRKTVQSFIKKNLYKKYGRLVIVNIATKSNHREDYIGEEGIFQIDTKEDIWDITNLSKDINDLDDISLKAVHDFLCANISFEPDTSLAKEIKTFMSLIAYLSDETQLAAGAGFIEEPDPKGKINQRFSDHSDFLKSEYVQLFREYGRVLNDVLEQSDLGQTRIRRLGLHLQTVSDQILTAHNGNAKSSLAALEQRYVEILSKSGVEYDTPSIRFFLVDQIIKCNVFPNKEQIANG